MRYSFQSNQDGLHTYEVIKEDLFGLKSTFLSLNCIIESHGSLNGLWG